MHSNMIQARGRAQKDICWEYRSKTAVIETEKKTDLLISFYRVWLSGLQGHIFGMEQEGTALPVLYRTMLGTSFFFFFLELPGCTVQMQALPLKNQKVGDPTKHAEQPSVWRADRQGLELSDSGNHSQHWWLGLSPLLQTNTDHWFLQRGCVGKKGGSVQQFKTWVCSSEVF